MRHVGDEGTMELHPGGRAPDRWIVEAGWEGGPGGREVTWNDKEPYVWFVSGVQRFERIRNKGVDGLPSWISTQGEAVVTISYHYFNLLLLVRGGSDFHDFFGDEDRRIQI